MACELLMQCDLIFGIISCILLENTIDVDLKVHTLWQTGTKRTEIHKSSNVALGELRSSPSHQLKIRMTEFMRHRQIINIPFASRSFQPRPKVTARMCNLVPLTRPNRAKHSHHRKRNVRPLPGATQWNWLATLGKAKDVAGATTSLAPTQTSQPMVTPSTLSPTSHVPLVKFTEHTKDCAICTPHGKICPKEFPMSSDWHNKMTMIKKKKEKKKKKKTKIKILKRRPPKPTTVSLQ